MVPIQNNVAMENGCCFPCNQPHNQATCSNGWMNQSLMAQNASYAQSEASSSGSFPQQESQENESSLFNWEQQDFNGVNDEFSFTSNTREKRRAQDMERAESQIKATTSTEPL